MNLREMVQWQTISGTPQTIGEMTVTPEAKALVLRWPKGGYVWNRPVAIVAQRDGATQRIPIADVTRQAQWGLYGLGAVVFLLLLLFGRRPNK